MSDSRAPGSDPGQAAARVLAGGGEMGRRCRETDWAATPLGPVEGWPLALRTAAALVLRSGFPSVLVWGPELIQIYNDAYVPLIGRRHPAALGAPTHACWPEIRHIQEPIFRRVLAGETVNLAAAHYPLARNGAVEDLYFDATFVPVPLETGEVGGSLSTLFDVTARVAAAEMEAERERLLEAEQEARRSAEALARRLAGVLDVMSDAHLVLDRDFRITYVNPAAERLLRLPREALLGRTHWEAFPASVDADSGRAIRRVAAEGVAEHLTQYYPWEGYDVHLEIDAYPTEEGGVAVFWRDVTARLRAEAERETFQVVAQHSSDAHALFDADGRVLWANRLMAERLGYSLDALRALTVSDIDPLYPLARYRALFEQAHGERLPPFESRHRRRDGSTFPVEITATVVELAEGVRLFAAVRDITERKQAEEEREKLLQAEHAARGEAEAANRAKTEFLAVVSHELRTPLNAISAYTELLDMGILGSLTERQRDAIQRIQVSQRHLLGLINEVLNYAKLEAGTVRYDIEDVPVAAILATVEQLVEPQAGARSLALEIGPCPPELAARADAEKLRQVLLNLIGNAIKFTEPGGRVGVRCEARAEWIAVAVSDTGSGIPADKLESIFEPFVQVRSDLTRTTEGTGLGLAISRDLARGMGGELTVESAPGRGSTFTLRLPRAGGPPVPPQPGG